MPVTPATLGERPGGQAAGVPYSPLYDDVYHATAGAWAQARHVFMGGNGLPARWRGRRRFVILETGFGLGNNFLATWAAWLADEQACAHLCFISIEKHPLQRGDLAAVHGLTATPSPPAGVPSDPDVDDAQRRALARQLVQAWPALTPGLHQLDFMAAGGRRVTLLLGLGDIAELLPGISASVDAFYLDGFAPAKNPQMWDEGLLSRLNRLAAPGATAATWSAARHVRDALSRAGFQVERAPGFAGKRDMIRAAFTPRHVPAPWPGGLWPEPQARSDRHALVIGAGLAGCAAARALCRAGWRVTLIDRHPQPATEGSGNPGGLFHSVLHAQDGIHARAHRAAAMAVWRQAAHWIAEGRLSGDAKGLLRLDGKADAAQAEAWLAKQALPPDHVRWLAQETASQVCGLAVPSGGWWFAQAGWLHPAGLARLMLDEAAAQRQDDASLLQTLWDTEVTRLAPASDDEHGPGDWLVYSGERLVARAPSVVLCGAAQTTALLTSLPPDHAVEPPPMSAVRGQISAWAEAERHGCRTPHLPVAGSGYVLTLPGGALLCGATTQHHDDDPQVREADHRHNLRQAARLGAAPPWPDDAPLPPGLSGRTAWRATTPDRLPLVGALPWSEARLATHAAGQRLDQVRLVPRERNARGGLYALTGLGSRGITWSCLAAALLAHWVAGEPCPVELDLRDAMDPARFMVRRLTRGRAAQ